MRPMRLGDGTLACAGVAAVAAGIAYIVWRTFVQPLPSSDFQFFWVAGKVWAAGGDPYRAGLAELGKAYLPKGTLVTYWFYPPQWWPICRSVAMLDFLDAAAVWRLASGAMILAGTAMIAWQVSDGGRLRRIGLTGLASGFAMLIEPSANLFSIGQSASFLYLALSFLVVGVLAGRWPLVAVGLFLSTLKPQVGVLLFLAVLLVPRLWPAIVAALAAALVCALPQLIAFGPIVSLREFLGNLGAWGAIWTNTLVLTSGPLHLVYEVIPLNLSPQIGMLLPIAMTLASGWLLRRDSDAPLPALLLLTAAVAVVPLHSYDLTLLVIPMMLATALAGRMTVAMVICAILLLRPSKIEMRLGLPGHTHGLAYGLISLSIVAVIVAVVAIRACIDDRAHRTRAA